MFRVTKPHSVLIWARLGFLRFFACRSLRNWTARIPYIFAKSRFLIHTHIARAHAIARSHTYHNIQHSALYRQISKSNYLISTTIGFLCVCDLKAFNRKWQMKSYIISVLSFCPYSIWIYVVLMAIVAIFKCGSILIVVVVVLNRFCCCFFFLHFFLSSFHRFGIEELADHFSSTECRRYMATEEK